MGTDSVESTEWLFSPLFPGRIGIWTVLEMLVFVEGGKPEYPEKNLSEQGREPTTNSTRI